MKNKWIIEVISAILIAIFVYAASVKLLNYSLFVTQLHTHPLLKHFAGTIAWIVPAMELFLSVLLLLPVTRRKGLYGSAFILLIFTIYLGFMFLSGKPLPCTCGGFISTFTWRQHIIFNLGLILLSIIGIRLYNSAKLFYRGSAKKKQPVRAVWSMPMLRQDTPVVFFILPDV